MVFDRVAVDWFEAICSASIVVLPLLFAIGLAFFASKHTVKQAKDFWHTVRTSVVSSVDETTDPFIVLMSTLAKKDPAEVVKVAKRVAEVFVEVLDKTDSMVDSK